MSMEQLTQEKEVVDAPEENMDDLAEPPCSDVPRDHPLWQKLAAALREVYDPEIPVNIFELGLIYELKILEQEDGQVDLNVKMSLTSPGCPVAQEMPGMVQGALFTVDEVAEVDVELVWDPPWDPTMMAETAKLQLNMFT